MSKTLLGRAPARKAEEQNAVVTGASSGIGRAIAIALAQKGISVCLVARDWKRLEAACEEAGKTAPLVLPYRADLTDDAAIRELSETIEQKFGGLDILVHCAGAYTAANIASTPTDEFDMLYKTNVRAPYALSRSLLPALRSRQGQLVFINSSQGLPGRGGNGPFASTQHALREIADRLRQEVNPDGMRVLSIHLGRTATPRMKAIFEFEGRPYQPGLLLQPEDVAEVVLNALAMPPRVELTNVEMRPSVKSY